MSNPRPYNIAGAPFSISAVVKVISLTDDTANSELLGRVGCISYYEYDCGCGQEFPHSPMIGVSFDGSIEEFWPEELELYNHR